MLARRLMKKKIVTTTDGSHSIFLPEMEEHYHSTHGAIAESEHIFIKSGLLKAAEKTTKLKVFEVGLGTGLNVLSSLKASAANNLQVDMHSIEAFPLSWSEVSQLNYPRLLGIDSDFFKKIHQSDWNVFLQLSDQFSLYKEEGAIQNYQFKENTFEVIYFDAFAPEKQENMWTEEIFSKLYHSLKPTGILVSYCVKGEVRRRLQKIGFEVEKLPGPVGGKREILRATKKV